MSSCFVSQISLDLADTLRNKLKEQGFIFTQPPHTIFQAKSNKICLTMYLSGKLTVQGKGMDEFIRYFLEPEILGTFSYGYESTTVDKEPRIGVDESGKGDYFGPLCVAGVYGDGSTIDKLLKIKVKDSKKLSDVSCIKLAAEIKKAVSWHVIRLNPLKYNELIERFGNLNLLLAWAHATIIDTLNEKTGCEKAIIDQFAAEHVVENALKKKKKNIFLTQRTKAEEDPVVAAASIVARASFLEGLEQLSQSAMLQLPKGASAKVIAVGKKLIDSKGSDILQHFAKMHFKTTQQILEKSHGQ